jgi:cation transport ATPase
MDEVRFVVEEAGCPTCATRVRQGLEHIATVAAIEIDEAADEATVRLSGSSAVTEDAVRRALEEISAGSGHSYRLRAGSWVEATT